MTTTITYDFQFDAGRRETVTVAFNPETLRLDPPAADDLPDWTALDFHRCANCPLAEAGADRCPLAVQLVGIARRLGQVPSYEKLTLHVRTEARIVSARTTAQTALGSLMGLIMPLSGCPRLAPLAPMARFHLPLSTHEETIYRVMSMYLLSRFFRDDAAPPADDGLSGLSDIYANIQQVNQGLSARMRNSNEFIEVNSVALLDLYAQTMPFVIEASLDDIRHLFEPEREVA
ncbi:MAG: hypothetical protein VW405_16080 [Rhodospirillaceae bacterium]